MGVKRHALCDVLTQHGHLRLVLTSLHTGTNMFRAWRASIGPDNVCLVKCLKPSIRVRALIPVYTKDCEGRKPQDGALPLRQIPWCSLAFFFFFLLPNFDNYPYLFASIGWPERERWKQGSKLGVGLGLGWSHHGVPRAETPSSRWLHSSTASKRLKEWIDRETPGNTEWEVRELLAALAGASCDVTWVKSLVLAGYWCLMYKVGSNVLGESVVNMESILIIFRGWEGTSLWPLPFPHKNLKSQLHNVLYGLGQITVLLWALISLSVMWGNTS